MPPIARVDTEARPALACQILVGREAILDLQPVLAMLAAKSGQTGDADNLAHFLSTPDAVKKIPTLVLFGQPSATPAEVTGGASELTGAVLLFEYRAGPFPSRVFSTADGSGRRNVLAPGTSRAQIAALAARTLLRRGAHVVHINFNETHIDRDSPRPDCLTCDLALTPHTSPRPLIARELRGIERASDYAVVESELPLYLPLLPTFDSTLARIGQKTRANLRYYRRRAQAELGCTFVPEVQIAREDFLALNRISFLPVPDALALWRFRSLLDSPNTFLRGIRDRDGRWLSLVGGRRQNGFAEIDWQMNRVDLPAFSLSTVMRSFLIEHEVLLGSTRLYIEGGTAQAIIRSFHRGRIGELTLCRRSLYTRLLRRYASRLFPLQNYLGQVLQDPALHWQRC